MTSLNVTNWSDCLVCPVCGDEMLLKGERTLHCVNGHEYDAARQGYFNLLTGRGTKFREDTPEMVAARLRFLEAGHYSPIADAIVAEVPREAQFVVDAGSGPGYYLNSVVSSLEDSGQSSQSSTQPRAVALDISRAAAKHAAKISNTLSLVTDLWSVLPLAANTVDVVLNVFAPHNIEEFRRVLKRGGRVIVVTPAPHHLQELRDAETGLLGMQSGKQEKLHHTFSEGFTLLHETNVDFSLSLDTQAIADLVGMGPAGHHTSASPDEESPTESAQATDGEPRTVSCGVVLSVFQKS
ncbi:putative RNA methyltransferase [Neomicrococcus lactis]|uniref:23S rRNA (Guanine745-N1)-methyltransferase n=1 Tax=Neomicrococcus lactis TaxID=732241 RepID=A0A7W8YAR9_9MICC|nr:23S rRNA (guanine745-N1)-methyltransferase [Neomicrococcus lactis]